MFITLITQPDGGDFRGFLQRHAALLSGLPAWTVRIALPAHLARYGQDLLQDARDQIASPMRDVVLDELRWYFEQRRKGGSTVRTVEDERRFRTAVEAFSGHRIPAMYQAWRRTARPR